jgi:hypothetical protein
VRKVTFHDLRHTTATLLAGLGTHSVIIQTLMRHSSLEQAMEYVGLVCGKKEAAVARMAFGFEFDSGGTAFAPAAERRVALSAGQKGTRRGPDDEPPKGGARASGKSQESPAVSGVGARGFEPPTPCAQGRCATRLRYAPSRTGVNTRGPPWVKKETRTPQGEGAVGQDHCSRKAPSKEGGPPSSVGHLAPSQTRPGQFAPRGGQATPAKGWPLEGTGNAVCLCLPLTRGRHDQAGAQ